MKMLNLRDLKISNTDKIICYCNHVTQKKIESAIRHGSKTLADIQKNTGAGTGNQCQDLNPSGKCCSGDIKMILENSGFGLIKPSCCK
jgi:NAD(P)H-nitrite reductase large subunit